MKNNKNSYQYLRTPILNQNEGIYTMGGLYKYVDLHDSNIRLSYPLEKENNLANTNMGRLSPSLYENDQRHAKSTTSTNQQTHPKTSTDNLHAHRLQSVVLQLQKTLDQQQYELQTLTQEASYFMKLCEEQKEILIQLNIEGMRSEYQQQIDELIGQRQKIQEIIGQLQDDYSQVYAKQENQLQLMRDKNNEISKVIEEELERKKCMLSLLAGKDRDLMSLEVSYRESEERLDELRNIERKLTIALRQLQMMRNRQGSTIKSSSTGRLNSREKTVTFADDRAKNRSKEKQIIYESPRKRSNEKDKSKYLSSTSGKF